MKNSKISSAALLTLMILMFSLCHCRANDNEETKAEEDLNAKEAINEQFGEDNNPDIDAEAISNEENINDETKAKTEDYRAMCMLFNPL
jgi:hypothetical protein